MTKRWKMCLAAAALPLFLVVVFVGLGILAEPPTDASSPGAQPAPVSDAKVEAALARLDAAWLNVDEAWRNSAGPAAQADAVVDLEREVPLADDNKARLNRTRLDQAWRDSAGPVEQAAGMGAAELRERCLDMLVVWCALVGQHFGETPGYIGGRTADAFDELAKLGIEEHPGATLLAAERYRRTLGYDWQNRPVPPQTYDAWLSDYVRERRAGRTWEQASLQMAARRNLHWAAGARNVLAVVDGDTLRIAGDLGESALVRLRRVNAPELDEPGGPEARDALRERLASGRVWVEPRAHDVYGRIVAEVSPLD